MGVCWWVGQRAISLLGVLMVAGEGLKSFLVSVWLAFDFSRGVGGVVECFYGVALHYMVVVWWEWGQVSCV